MKTYLSLRRSPIRRKCSWVSSSLLFLFLLLPFFFALKEPHFFSIATRNPADSENTWLICLGEHVTITRGEIVAMMWRSCGNHVVITRWSPGNHGLITRGKRGDYHAASKWWGDLFFTLYGLYSRMSMIHKWNTSLAYKHMIHMITRCSPGDIQVLSGTHPVILWCSFADQLRIALKSPDVFTAIIGQSVGNRAIKSGHVDG